LLTTPPKKTTKPKNNNTPQEHAYYASFGYHVTSPFAVSSRSGSPEELKRLVDTAHSLGLRVLLDVVHSHASKNETDGVAGFDLGGGEGALVRTGDAGYHALWDSRVFSYERLETKRYLLSNLKYWIVELGFDGFRFDGVTSMLYQHHGIGVGFSGNYGEYFGLATDVEACVYLMLANEMLHGLSGAPPPSSSAAASPLPPPPPDVLTIAEDVSGMPGLCAPVSGGGLGFDARLAMAAPDLWIRLLKHVPDEGWPVSQIVATLCGRRYGEGRLGTVGYSESHDQAMVGDKTIAMWLFGPEIYDGMSALRPPSPVIERGLALHKTISAATAALGGEARMTFMGNEFGHPEWIDFPTAQNGWSHKFARRQWSLADREDLRYGFLLAWDRALNAADDKHGFVSHGTQWVTMIDDGRQLIVAERGPLLWVLNFSPHLAHGALRVPCPQPGKWRVVLDSDATCFGGQGRVPWKDYYTSPADEEEGGQFCGRAQWLEVVSPPRTAVAFVRVKEEEVGTESGDGASEAVFPPDYGLVAKEEKAVESEAASEQTVGGGAAEKQSAVAAEAPAASAAPAAGDAEEKKKSKGKDDDDEGSGGKPRGDYVVFRF
jgi:1,4-alpha-glucan branching enzyme